jgi:transposase-like protein
MGFWIPKPIDFVLQGVTNEGKAGRIPEPAATTFAAHRGRGSKVNLKVPKLLRQTFKTAIIECYRRRESRSRKH